MDEKTPELAEIIETAKETLTAISEEVTALVPTAPEVQMNLPMAPDLASLGSLQMQQKFGDLPTQLRDTAGVNLFEVRKLNLAVTLEALERAVEMQERFPSADASFAVSSLSDQAAKLVKDLDKAQDPRKIYEQIVDVLHQFSDRIVHSVAAEMKWLLGESRRLVPAEKEQSYVDTVKQATNRIGPSLREGLESSKGQLLAILHVKENS